MQKVFYLHLADYLDAGRIVRPIEDEGRRVKSGNPIRRMC
jgi:hypothetical protein